MTKLLLWGKIIFSTQLPNDILGDYDRCWPERGNYYLQAYLSSIQHLKTRPLINFFVDSYQMALSTLLWGL